MEWKDIAEVGAVVGCVIGWGVGALWLQSYTKSINKILFREGGGLNIVTVEMCDKCRAECRKGVESSMNNQLVPILSGINEMKNLFAQKVNDDRERHDREERRMQRLVSINGNVAVALSLLAERRKPDEQLPTLDAAIKRIENDVQELAG